MVRLKQFFSLCLSVIFLAFSFIYTPLPVYASGSDKQNYFIALAHFVESNRDFYSYVSACVSTGNNVYLYGSRDNTGLVSYYFVSDSAFKFFSFGKSYSSESEQLAQTGFGTSLKSSQLVSTGYHYAFAQSQGDSGIYDKCSFETDLQVIYFDADIGYPWLSEDFVLGEDLSGGGGSSIVYDSSIPAPQNLTFKSESVGGFLGVGSKWEHTLSWSNGLATPPLFARIYASAEVVFTDTGQFFEDSTIPLVRQEDVFKAETGRYSIGTDELSSKIMDGTVLNKVLQYRVQFCRYDSDGKLLVGPISTVHIKQNLFGKYDGYTVTTEYPKDESDLGQSGGMDDSYVDKWTSDGERYDEYDKDGNHIGSGQSDDVSPIQKILNFFKDIPLIINSLFDSLMGLMSGVGQIPSLLSQLFSFLPVEIISLIGLGLTVVIVLRIFGR